MQRNLTRTLGILSLAAGLSGLSSSCTKDLNQVPTYSATSNVVYSDPAQILQVLARLYATFAVSGQQGPAGNPDISGIDEGFSNYLRQYWQIQEVTTDEAVIGWNDGNLPSLNTLQWNADNEFVRATYDRVFYEISLCNEFIRQTSDANLSSRGITGATANTVRTYRSEARLLRALCYWHAIDLFGGGPFATEADAIGTTPQYKKGADMFTYVESELKALDGLDTSSGALLDPRAVYARADKGVLWTLLTKLYLNAKTYTGADRSTDAITYANKVLGAGYSLSPSYANLFLADNNTSTARNEIIFPITFDGTRTQTYGGMTYLVHAPTGRAITASSVGIDGGWSGLRTKPSITALFGSTTTNNPTDVRSQMFVFKGQNPNVDTLGQFTSGVLISKYRNVTSTGTPGSNLTFPDTDFPMFRLADVMLMYAEAVLRGGTGGSATQALAYVNAIRARAGAAPTTTGAFTLNSILDERARELFWEGHRRTDLIRFGVYTTGYNWAYKGGVKAGKDVESFRSLFPIPNTDRVANSNLPQNPGY
ncbi:RagB/SusD family nutrient uptake outer membrane protein [Hymenobacter sp. BRD128]|uniref:RagB/SusD family nutrient uptake outer membrane protein n=1 Tax=Hymenobacter sp. BRD128 TaxID=2675878 RepID=UPI001563B026|nr:RagB/SusD family nutrient uptake outer membrane protein [Hymenobacter sp. BRD128]QKG55900.1 RagB/SusD family nutrient uptake outer membrane protein [Hymenobacter sp. BRD128]